MTRVSLAIVLCVGLAAGQRITNPAPTVVNLSTDERIKTYETKLTAKPDDLSLQNGLILSYLQKMRETGDGSYLERASRLVDRILQKDPDNALALHYQNEIDLQWHRFQKVAERSENMLKYAPSDSGLWGNLGDASMELGNYSRAQEAYLHMYSTRPGLASLNRLAFFKFVTGDPDTAIAYMQQAVAAGADTPENVAWCYAELGDMLFKVGKNNEARQAYQAALDLFPNLHRAHAGLGRLAASEDKVDEAIGHYKTAQSIVPLVDYSGALEDLYIAAGQTKLAAQERSRIEAMDALGRAANEKTNRNLVLILADHSRNLKRALELIEAEIPVRGDVYTWDAYSWVLFKAGRVAEAAKANARAMRYNTPEPSFRKHADAIHQAVAAVTAQW